MWRFKWRSHCEQVGASVPRLQRYLPDFYMGVLIMPDLLVCNNDNGSSG